MLTDAERTQDSGAQTRRLHWFVAVGLLGLLLITVGLAIDIVLHARDPGLAGEEGLLRLENPGRVLLGAGIAATALGLGGVASTLIAAAGTPSRLLRMGRLSLHVGLVVLIGALGYVFVGPGSSHDDAHDHGDIAAPTTLSDGTQLSSSVAAKVDRSRYPPAEAQALVALASRRPGTLQDDGLGHEHGAAESEPAELSPAESEVLAAQLAIAAQAVPDLDTVEEAAAAGYVQASTRTEGVGEHWVKWSLVDRPFDLAVPSMLLFEEVTWGTGPELVAFSYWVNSTEEPDGFAGETDKWHSHFGLCLEDGWLRNESVPDRSLCAGDWINGSDLWMLHAWVVPGMENRSGVFETMNLRLCERFCE